jgi:hypothetical protein
MVWVDQAGGGVGLPGVMQISAISGNLVTLLTVPTGTPPPLADATQSGLLRQVSGNTTDFVDGTNNCQNLVNAITPTIQLVRLRSFNALGNPNFEVTQRNVGANLANPASGTFVEDRWTVYKAGTMAINAGCGATPLVPPISAPNTGFGISSHVLTATLTTQEATLAATDYWQVGQTIEGPLLREFGSDPTSFSILCASNVAGLKFSIAFRDSPATKSLVKLCTIPASGWQLIQLSNIPAITGGNFNLSPGSVAYQLSITLACGSTYLAPAADTWQTGNFLGAPGMSNFAASPVNSLFQVAFVQHEPGPNCSQLMDLDFPTNYDRCLRYFQKTYDYQQSTGTVTSNGIITGFQVAPSTTALGSFRFHKPMAKDPTVTLYDHNNGAAGSVMDGAAVHHTGAAPGGLNQTGFYALTFTTATAASTAVYAHYTADTGW